MLQYLRLASFVVTGEYVETEPLPTEELQYLRLASFVVTNSQIGSFARLKPVFASFRYLSSIMLGLHLPL